MGRPNQRKKKRKFYGNRFTKKAAAVKPSPVARRFSAMKEAGLSSGNDVESTFSSIIMDNNFFDLIIQELRCDTCNVKSCVWEILSRFGFACKVRITCSECLAIVFEGFTSHRKDFGNDVNRKMADEDVTSDVEEQESASEEENSENKAAVETSSVLRPYYLNSRIIFAAQKTGIHMEKLNEFFSISGISGAISRGSYYSIFNEVAKTTTVFAQESMAKARTVVKNMMHSVSDESAKILSIAVSFDGSWQTRGLHSNYGIAFVREPVTNGGQEVVKVVVFSDFGVVLAHAFH